MLSANGLSLLPYTNLAIKQLLDLPFMWC